ncbi:GrpB family protein [Promicromonospora sukumoe]|uniref:GrpB family protein n=1 Tax=Promicromonospora sukumoe TaxID=88382 RepID=UPI00037C5FF0|nr:GrpB family protein [Promicromonospora sukumoe]
MLEEYDHRWPELYTRAAAELLDVEPSWEVEHIGSTAIPGMAAKPIIDLAVRVGSLAEVRARLDELAARGWLRIARGPRSHLVLVKQQGPRRTHIAHFFVVEQWAGCHQRLFRDWLLTHQQDAERYLDVKRRAAQLASDGPDYTARKAAVVQEIVDRARAAQGLPQADIAE